MELSSHVWLPEATPQPQGRWSPIGWSAEKIQIIMFPYFPMIYWVDHLLGLIFPTNRSNRIEKTSIGDQSWEEPLDLPTPAEASPYAEDQPVPPLGRNHGGDVGNWFLHDLGLKKISGKGVLLTGKRIKMFPYSHKFCGVLLKIIKQPGCYRQFNKT